MAGRKLGLFGVRLLSFRVMSCCCRTFKTVAIRTRLQVFDKELAASSSF
jgi:hypothetical protein